LSIKEVQNQILTHEHELGEQLNECVHSDRLSDFSLMLAMLNDDAREFSEFKLPKTEIKAQAQTEQSFRKSFELPEKAPLSLRSLEEISSFNNAELIDNNELLKLKLQEALTPSALAFRDDKSHIPTQVMANTSLHCQNRQRKKLQGQETEKPSPSMNFNAKLWLTALQNTIVKAPLLAV